jgi:hypothetical protein
VGGVGVGEADARGRLQEEDVGHCRIFARAQPSIYEFIMQTTNPKNPTNSKP